ncbi:hypothetical protein B4N84_27495 [Flavobacterium sp. IR1]|nr:hypothetical protein B4N84_27495 [Flavobacterium sp. IR1]
MGTSISFGEYEAEKISEPWEKSRYRDLYRSYYSQSIHMKINTDNIELVHCITALTSLELNICYTDSEFDVHINKAPRHCYLSALTIYMDNKGQIIKGKKVITEFMLTYERTTGRHLLDASFQIKKKPEECIDGEELHHQVLKNKTLTFKTGKIYVLDKFHEYIAEASLCNRRTDVNYTNLKVTEDRDALNKRLNLYGISLAAFGFVPGKATVITDTAMKILGLALSVEPRFNLAAYTYPINGPVHLDEKTTLKVYERESYNGYISPQKLKKQHLIEGDVLKQLDNYGLKNIIK